MPPHILQIFERSLKLCRRTKFATAATESKCVGYSGRLTVDPCAKGCRVQLDINDAQLDMTVPHIVPVKQAVDTVYRWLVDVLAAPSRIPSATRLQTFARRCGLPMDHMSLQRIECTLNPEPLPRTSTQMWPCGLQVTVESGITEWDHTRFPLQVARVTPQLFRVLAKESLFDANVWAKVLHRHRGRRVQRDWLDTRHIRLRMN